MKVITPPKTLPLKELKQGEPSVFLAGSIEMGTAEPWQDLVVDHLKEQNLEGLILNPRRADWNPELLQSCGDAIFKGQVDWELTAMENAGLLAFNFDPKTKSAITLFELGLTVGDTRPAIVHCPAGYWKKGNVDVICQRFQVLQVTTFEELLYEIARYFKAAAK